MEQHLPMRMSLLGNGPPLGNSTPALPLAMDEYASTTAAKVIGRTSDTFMPPSQLLSTGTSHAGVDDETRHLLAVEGGSDLDLQLPGKCFLTLDRPSGYIVMSRICFLEFNSISNSYF